MLKHLSEIPAFERVTATNGIVNPPTRDGVVRWGMNYQPAPPAIGTEARATFNRMGRVIVTGYFVEEGYLGCVAELQDAEPIQRNGGKTTVYLFGTEIAPL